MTTKTFYIPSVLLEFFSSIMNIFRCQYRSIQCSYSFSKKEFFLLILYNNKYISGYVVKIDRMFCQVKLKSIYRFVIDRENC